MRINEVEQLLGISKANIRFYEKQKLLSPGRTENGYREYTDEDIQQLKRIVTLRKLGINLENIRNYLSGEIGLSEILESHIAALEQQTQTLNASLRLSRQLQNDLETEASEERDMDLERYWQAVNREKTTAETFSDTYPSFFDMMEDTHARRLGIDFAADWKTNLIYVLITFLCVALVRTYLFKDGDFWSNFFYIPKLLIILSVILYPTYWLLKKKPKLGMIVLKILGVLVIVFLVLIVLLLILLLLNAIFHFWY